jgi:hypothetical protein
MGTALIRPHPLSSLDQRELALPEGLTLDEIARLVWPDEATHRFVVCYVGDRRVPSTAWRRVRPKAGAMVRMGLTCFQGGGGGSKGVLSMIAMIAIAIFAPYAAGAILGAGASSVAVGALAAGISLVGAMLVGAIFKPPAIDAGGATNSPNDAPTYSITGQQNQATPYAPVLRVYGQHRIFPRLAAVPYTTNEGPSQFLYMLLDCGYGPLQIERLQIGDTPILNYRDLIYKVHERWKAGDALDIYRNDTIYDTFNLTLAQGVANLRTSADDATGLVFEFVCPRGLISFGEHGEHNGRAVQFAIAVRPAGSAGAWQPSRTFPLAASHSYSTALEVGQVLIISQHSYEWGEQIFYYLPPGSTQCTVTSTTPPLVGDLLDIARQSTHTVTAVGALDANGQRVLTFTPPTPVHLDGGVIDAQLRRASESLLVADATSSPVLFSITLDVPAGRWEVRVTRESAPSDSDRVFDELVWTSLRSVHDRAPIAVSTDHTLIELKVRASNQLSGVIQNVNCLATSKLPVWDGVAWSEQATRNPAWAYVDVLRGPGSVRPLPENRLDLERLAAWAEYCDTLVANGVDGEPEARVRFDHVVDYATTTFQLLQSIASAGRASPSVRDGRHGVIVDEEQTVAVQLFTPRNSWGFGARRVYLSEPNALRVKFVDPENNWQEGNVVVYAAGFNAENSTTFEDLKLFGVTRYTQATRDARYLKAQALLRREEFSIFVDVENLIAARGDLVEVQHDVLKVGGESSRIRAVAGNRITLFDPFGTLANVRYGVRIRLADGTITPPIEVTPEAPDVLILSAVPTPPPAAGDLVAWGYLEIETGEYLVKQIAPGDDLTAQLTLAEIARGVYTADTGEIPAYVPPAGGRPTAGPGPKVEGLAVEQRDKTIGREPYCDLVLTWHPPQLGGYPRYRVYRIEDGGVQVQLAETSNVAVVVEVNLRILDPDVVATPFTFAVIGVDGVGRESDPAFVSYTPSDPLLVPGDPAYLSSNAHDKTATLTWRAANDPSIPGNDQVMFYEVRWVDDPAPVWGNASRITELVPWNVTTVTVPARNGAYLVKAITSSQVESALPAVTVIAVEDLVIQDVWRLHRWAPEWDGVKDRVTVDATGRLILAARPDGTFPPVGIFYASGRETFSELLQCRISSTMIASGLNNTLFMRDWIPLSLAVPLSGGRRGVDWDASVWVIASDDLPFVMEDWTPLEIADPLDPTPEVATDDWRPLLHGEYIARDLQFAVVLESFAPNVSPRVQMAGCDIDFPERTEEHADIVVPVSGLDFLFARPFVFAPSVAVDLQDAAPGDYVDRGPVDQAGFPLFIRDAAGAAKAGTVDVSAFGVGRTL